MSEDDERYITAKQAARVLGVHPVTLYRWAKEGKIRFIKTPSGRLRYPRSEIERLKSSWERDRNVLIYARVSDEELVRRGLLERQMRVLEDYAEKNGYNIVEVIKDVSFIGKKNLVKIINMAVTGRIGKILVVSLDRLFPVFPEVFRDILNSFGVKVEIVEFDDPEMELEKKMGLIDLIAEHLKKVKI